MHLARTRPWRRGARRPGCRAGTSPRIPASGASARPGARGCSPWAARHRQRST